MFNFGAIAQWVSQSRAIGTSLGQIARELLGIGPRAIAPTREPMPRSRPVAPGRRPPRPPPRSPVSVPDDDLPPPEPPQRGPQPPSGGDDQGPFDQRRLREVDEAEVLTPQSSNVYSFRYERATSTLFVTYKVSERHDSPKRPIERDRSLSGGGRLSHQQVFGGVSGDKLNAPGATYAYYDVPIRLFVRMKLAVSKGTFVWDELRIRGSIHGHKFRYSLVGAAHQPDGDAPYIPRRATAAGFRTRALADKGSGSRGFRTSTLPQKQFPNRSKVRGRESNYR